MEEIKIVKKNGKFVAEGLPEGMELIDWMTKRDNYDNSDNEYFPPEERAFVDRGIVEDKWQGSSKLKRNMFLCQFPDNVMKELRNIFDDEVYEETTENYLHDVKSQGLVSAIDNASSMG